MKYFTLVVALVILSCIHLSECQKGKKGGSGGSGSASLSSGLDILQRLIGIKQGVLDIGIKKLGTLKEGINLIDAINKLFKK